MKSNALRVAIVHGWRGAREVDAARDRFDAIVIQHDRRPPGKGELERMAREALGDGDPPLADRDVTAELVDRVGTIAKIVGGRESPGLSR